ncbi:MAG TPA: hypothetical protein VHE35_12950 [Kofleriaceae bacterium]|nr:hypothetical protein [Kofleriaceae bacterium]
MSIRRALFVSLCSCVGLAACGDNGGPSTVDAGVVDAPAADAQAIDARLIDAPPDTAFTIDFDDLATGAPVASDRYAAKGVVLGTTGGSGLLTGESQGASAGLGVNTVAKQPPTILVVMFHVPGDPQSVLSATQVGFRVLDTESSATVRSYDARTGGTLLQTIPITMASTDVTLGGTVARIEVEDVGADGFIVDDLAYHLPVAPP